MMTFNDAVKSMLDGNNVCRAGSSESYLCILPNKNYIWSIGVDGRNPVVNAYVYVPSVEDILAKDYIVK